MPINSRSKGIRGELQWRDFLRQYLNLQDCERGAQRSGSADSPDVKNGIPDTHCEVKYTEKLNIYKAMEQSIRDAQTASNPEEPLIPYVAHRKNAEQWHITINAHNMIHFARAVLRAYGDEIL